MNLSIRNPLKSVVSKYDPEQIDASIEGVRKLLEYIQKDPTVEATTMSTVGEKGYDGFIYAVNKSSF